MRRTLGALGVDVQVDLDPAASVLLDEFEPLVTVPSKRPPVERWSVEASPEGWRFRPGRAKNTRRSDLRQLVGPVVDRLNHVVGRRSSYVVVHAGAISLDDAGVLIAGPTSAGKSTLTAALTVAGAAYLGDEAIGIDAASGRLLGYPKPVSLKADPHTLLPRLARIAVPGVGPERWEVPMQRIREGAIVPDAAFEHVVLHRYEPGADTSLTPISRAEAVFELSGLVFRFEERARRSLDTLTAALGSARCHRMVSGELKSATERVLRLVSSTATSPGR